MTERNEHHTFKANQIPYQEISDPAVLSKNPLVSVKMITYNHEPYIAQAIEGVVKQETEYPFELIIGEDCSTDKTMEIVLEYQKKYPQIIRVITSDKNVGMKRNGYRTMKACRGKYIAFCEGDDYWHHAEKLQKQVDYLESHPECGMISADCDIYYNNTNKFKKRFNYNNGFTSPKNLDIEEVLLGELAIWTCTVVIRKELHDQIRKNDPYLYQNDELALGDLQTWAEMISLSKVTYFPDCLATYRVLDESASRSKDPKKNLRFLKSLSDIKLYLSDKYDLSEIKRKREEMIWCDRSLQLAFHERDIDLAREVRKRQQAFTWKEWFRYFGVKYLLVNYLYRVSLSFLNLFRKPRKQWP